MVSNYVCSIDEAGRGPGFSIMTVAAVITTKAEEEILLLNGVTDSKKIKSLKKRELLYDLIKNTVTDYNIGVVQPEEIDDLGIYSAWDLGCYRAVEGLKYSPDFIKVDGDTIISSLYHINQTAIVKGDLKEVSIGAASILAKVWRDRYVVKEVQDLSIDPLYSIETNKGYLTAQHRKALKEIGYTSRHRKSFIKKFI